MFRSPASTFVIKSAHVRVMVAIESVRFRAALGSGSISKYSFFAVSALRFRRDQARVAAAGIVQIFYFVRFR